ncbi:hypothetical protein [Roseisalinus antarcticus]|uniref:Uncharacterized protein n=1 Tax=Roseisalinus antarcticus TaxID=254357 RepID=A0A1Y5TT87_9RHOB|nr:hypothetical protein [Roseisalinus antarcticus]SLN71472.1 hypothetical protein ROA7023_03509 [Roseisalinus antarcticus]
MKKFDDEAQKRLLIALSEVYPGLMDVDEAKAILAPETRDFNWAYLVQSALVEVVKEMVPADDPHERSTAKINGAKITAKGIDLLRAS